MLHLTFHKGTANEIEGLSKKLSFDLTTWYIHDLPPYFFNGLSRGSDIYNIGHEEARNIWELHSDFFHQFDLIITSDTAMLSRIFLQNDSKIPLIVWVCNRFDYCNPKCLSDGEYYRLINDAKNKPHITIISNTEFEQFYAKSKGVDLGPLVIKPCGLSCAVEGIEQPSHHNRAQLFYVPVYHNEEIYKDLSNILNFLGIQHFHGRHNGLGDLKFYKGIIHFPYSWSTIALFENMQLHIPYFIPSKSFFCSVSHEMNYWHQNSDFIGKTLELSEWYNKENSDLFVYFDSWRDLTSKLNNCDYAKKRESIKALAKRHQEKSLSAWQDIFKKIEYLINKDSL